MRLKRLRPAHHTAASSTSTIRSLARASSVVRRFASSTPSGTMISAFAWNIGSPDIEPVNTRVSNSSMLMLSAESALEILWMMPGGSTPVGSSRTRRPTRAAVLVPPLRIRHRYAGIAEPAERRLKRVAFARRHTHAQDASELPAEPRHGAVDPVAAVLGDHLRQRFDQPRSVPRDHRQHHLVNHPSFSLCPEACSGWGPNASVLPCPLSQPTNS